MRATTMFPAALHIWQGATRPCGALLVLRPQADGQGHGGKALRRVQYAMPVKYNPDLWPACWVLQLIANGNLHAFYTSTEWKRTRRKVLKRQRRRCWDCEHKSPAKITRGTTVHHINELRQRPDLALSEYDEAGRPNLVCLCSSCHWERHHQRLREITPERW